MRGVRVRRYRPGDGARVRELNRLAMRETPEWVPDAPEEDLQDVRRQYLDQDGEFLVAELDGPPDGEFGDGEDTDEANGDVEDFEDGAIVAMGAYCPLDGWMAEQFDAVGGTVELTRIRVDPAFQARGIGAKVVQALEQRARRVGYRAAALNTGAANEQARAFYDSLGYCCVRTVSVTFEDVSLELALYYSSL